MSLRTQLAYGLRVLFRRPGIDRELTDEIEHYVSEATAAYRAQGLPDAEARRAAQLDMGSRTSVVQQVRAGGWEMAVESLLVDLRRAARRLRRTPGFAVVTVITLALGIGASTAIFSVVRPVLLESLPYPDPDDVVVIADGGGPAGASIDVTFGTFRELAARSRSISWAAVTRGWQPTITGDGEAERLDGQSVSAGYFRVLGVAPAAGRDFSEADDAPGAPPVAIISEGLWRRRFGADPRLVGHTMTLDGAPVTVIGIMPQTFENVWQPEARIWRPLGYDPSLPAQGREWGHHLQLLARLVPGTDLDAARRELALIARTTVPPFDRPAWARLDGGLVVTPMQDQVTTQAKPALRAVILATLLLLLIAAVNVVNLMLARGMERQNELATCAAFGASRLRMLTPLLAEGVLLAALGGALGVGLAYAMVSTLVSLEGFSLPRLQAIHVDRMALAFDATLSAGIGITAGCMPGLLLSSRSQVPMAAARILTSHQRLRRGFVAAEVALALVLLVGAGLLVRTIQQLLAVSPGFRPEGVLTLQIQTSGSQLSNTVAIRQFFEAARAAVQGVPGVVSANLTNQLPLTGDADVYGVGTAADSTLPPGADRGAFRYAVSPGHLETMGIPLLSGRAFDEGDRTGAPSVAIVSAALARRRFAGGAALGQRIRVGGPDVLYTVVGVAGDVKQSSLAASSPEAVYVPAAQWRFADRAMWLVIHSAVDPASIEPAARRAIQAVNRNQPILRVATMEQRILASAGRQRFVMMAFDTFAIVALLLATIGIYGVLAAGVVERTRELALRAAVGASRTSLIGLVLRQAGSVAAPGMVVGAGAAIVVSRALAALLFDVSPLDATTYISVVLLLTMATGAGAIIPAWRAARIAPAVALHP